MSYKQENITIKSGQRFKIILESNPTTGYKWYPAFDNSVISLISHDFQPSTSRGMGRSGYDIFTFLAINYGSDNLKMLYKRSWDKRSAAEKIFLINVK